MSSGILTTDGPKPEIRAEASIRSHVMIDYLPRTHDILFFFFP